MDAHGCCIFVVSEGLKNAAGEEIAADKSRLDAFGHPVLSGAAEHLAELVTEKLKIKTRTVKLGYAQRAAAHYASQTDATEAAACGAAAVRAAVEGQSGCMVKIVRTSSAPLQMDDRPPAPGRDRQRGPLRPARLDQRRWLHAE